VGNDDLEIVTRIQKTEIINMPYYPSQ